MEYIELDNDLQFEGPPFTDTEIKQIIIRVIALENLAITLLSEASDRQRGLGREMANYIIPRAGKTQHPLTMHASAHMTQLIERANHFKARPS